MVDWDADRLIGVEELIEEFSEDVVDGNLDGLVVSHNVRELFPKSDHFVPFDDEHDWIPYKGTRAFR